MPPSRSVADLRQRAALAASARICRRLMQAAGLARLLAERPPEAIAWPPVAMWVLYRQVRTRRPGLILELGTGCSTLIMAEALRRNGTGHLLCLDSDARWIDETHRIMPAALRPHVTLVRSALVVEEIDGAPCHRYRDLPQQPIDFLYLDGPAAADVPGWQGDPVSADPVHLEAQFNRGFRMVVDKRRRTTEFLRRSVRRSYRATRREIANFTVFDLVE